LTGGTLPFSPLWSREGVKFDATKFNWLGSMESWLGLVFVRKGAPAQSFAQLLTNEIKVGATGIGDVTAVYPRVLNALAGTKFNIVRGYRGTADLNLAIDAVRSMAGSAGAMNVRAARSRPGSRTRA
jgi:hypothetical protein